MLTPPMHLESYLILGGSRSLCQFRNATTQLPKPFSSPRRYYASKNNGNNGKNGVNQDPTKPSPSSALKSPRNSALQFKQNPSPDLSTTTTTTTTASKKQQQQQQQQQQPKDEDEVFEPPFLDRPIGLLHPPQEGQNTGIDTRSIRQRRDDFVDYERHLARRRELSRQVSKPYYRDWKNLKYHQGKTFVSNPRLFKQDKALYFPNLFGTTLASPRKPQNTTPILRGRVSIVNLFSNVWAESQTASFTGQERNPGLYEAIAEGNANASQYPLVQQVDVNLTENALKAWLVRLFMWRLRRNSPEVQHPRYFLVRKGLNDSLKEAIGMMNSQVGYVYLLDEFCRIRWAGCGPAQESELDVLNDGVMKLVEERISVDPEVSAVEGTPSKGSNESMRPKPRVLRRS